jgi:hypothetical protein
MGLKDTVKQWFKTNDYPTESQFAQFFDSIFFKDEAIEITSIVGLQAILNALAPVGSIVSREVFTVVGTSWDYVVPNGFILNSISVLPTTNTTAYCGYTGGDLEALVPNDGTIITSASGALWVINEQVFTGANKSVTVTAPAGTVLIFVTTKIS